MNRRGQDTRYAYRPLIGNKEEYKMTRSSGVGLTVLAVLAAIVAAVALGLAIWGRSDISSGNFGDVKIGGMLDLTDAVGITDPQYLIVDAANPPPTPAPTAARRRTAHLPRTPTGYFQLPPSNQKVLLEGTDFGVHIPTNLRRYRNKVYTVYSNSDDQHNILFDTAVNYPGDSNPIDYNDERGRKCREEEAPAQLYWDKKRRYTNALFDAKAGCYIVFEVVDCYTVIVHESRGVKFCLDDLETCDGASAQITEDLTITGDLVLEDMEDKVLEVGPTKKYATIADALAYANGRHTGVATVRVDKGTYVSTTEIGAKFASGDQFFETATRPETRGLVIIGDERGIAGQNYVNGAPVLGSGSPTAITVTGGTVNLNDGFLADWSVPFNLGTLPYSLTASAILADDGSANPEEGCGFYTNPANYVGKIVLVRRGTCGFVQKASRAFNASAAAVLIYNQAGGVIPIGGPAPTPNLGPVVFISAADGNALVAQLPLTVTISKQSEVTPPVGTPGSTVTFSHPGGLSTLRVAVSNAPAGVSLEQPNFPTAGLITGDRVVVTCGGRPVFGLDRAVQSEVIVASSAGNTITFQNPLPQDLSVERSDCSITILPNRVLQGSLSPDGQTLSSVISVTQSGSAVFRGFSIEGNPAAGFAQGSSLVSVRGGSLRLPNCVVNNIVQKANGGIQSISGHIGDQSENLGIPGVGGTLTLLDADMILFEKTQGSFVNLNFVGSSLSALRIDSQSSVWASSLMVGWSDSIDNFNNPGILLESQSSLHVVDTFYTYRNWVGGIWVTTGSTLTTGDMCQTQFVRNNHVAVYTPPIPDIFAASGAKVVLDGPVEILQNFQAAEVFNRSFVQVAHAHAGSTVAITNSLTIVPLSPVAVDLSNPWIESGGSHINIANTAYAPGNIRTQTEDGTFDPAFEVTVFSGGARDVTFRLTDQVNRIPPGFGTFDFESEYVGKTFRLINGDGSAHTVFLFTGTFTGNGVANPGVDNLLTFPTTSGAYVVMTVTSPSTVVIETLGAANTSTLVRRRNEIYGEERERTLHQHRNILPSPDQAPVNHHLKPATINYF